MYPTGALIVNLRPNISPASYKHLTVCIKPFKDSAGANIYLEKTGELKLLVRDGERSPSRVYCFGYDQGGLFVEATPQQDISRKITGFQYELMSKGIAADLHTASGECPALVTLPPPLLAAQQMAESEWVGKCWMGVSVLLRTCFINRAIAEELIWFLVCCCVLEAGGMGWTPVVSWGPQCEGFSVPWQVQGVVQELALPYTELWCELGFPALL